MYNEVNEIHLVVQPLISISFESAIAKKRLKGNRQQRNRKKILLSSGFVCGIFLSSYFHFWPIFTPNVAYFMSKMNLYLLISIYNIKTKFRTKRVPVNLWLMFVCMYACTYKRLWRVNMEPLFVPNGMDTLKLRTVYVCCVYKHFLPWFSPLSTNKQTNKHIKNKAHHCTVQ